ncbi:MAG TPA: CDP-alcohol phosphatidyltransferase family protein [Chthoniobacterales bacterium]|nr:CDP-alcohol phosphatidyltransferase family protein [Chthoniobacterales bacterium]
MAAPVAQPPPLEATYKARQTEGVLDLYFYRRVGFQLAKFFGQIGMSPIGVTLCGGVFGILAGHLYFYRNFGLNLLGIILQVTANVFDNADGQLARLQNRESRTGRILDGVVDYLVWLSVYVHLALRHVAGGGAEAVWLIALLAMASHATQSAAADYARHAYFHFAKNRRELESSAHLRGESPSGFWAKLLLGLYANLVWRQEKLSPALTKLRDEVGRDFSHQIPDWLRSRYECNAQPTLKWWRLFMANTRMAFLFVLLLIGQPLWFFWIEITVFNALLVYLLWRQQLIANSCLEALSETAA